MEEGELPLSQLTGPVGLSGVRPATGIIFREVSADYDLDWHPAPRRQYIVNLDAGVQITASDGETRRIGAGEVLLVEDTWGKGHRSKALDGDRKSTRLNSSHGYISYAVFCLKKKKKTQQRCQ